MQCKILYTSPHIVRIKDVFNEHMTITTTYDIWLCIYHMYIHFHVRFSS